MTFYEKIIVKLIFEERSTKFPEEYNAHEVHIYTMNYTVNSLNFKTPVHTKV